MNVFPGGVQANIVVNGAEGQHIPFLTPRPEDHAQVTTSTLNRNALKQRLNKTKTTKIFPLLTGYKTFVVPYRQYLLDNAANSKTASTGTASAALFMLSLLRHKTENSCTECRYKIISAPSIFFEAKKQTGDQQPQGRCRSRLESGVRPAGGRRGYMPRSGDWHSELLYVSSRKTPGVRPAIISAELQEILSDYKAFRHLYRHAYTKELRWKKMVHLALNIQDGWTAFKKSIGVIIQFLQKIINELEKNEP